MDLVIHSREGGLKISSDRKTVRFGTVSTFISLKKFLAERFILSILVITVIISYPISSSGEGVRFLIMFNF